MWWNLRERGGKGWRRLEFLLRLILEVNPRLLDLRNVYLKSKCFEDIFFSFLYYFLEGSFGMKIDQKRKF